MSISRGIESCHSGITVSKTRVTDQEVSTNEYFLGLCLSLSNYPNIDNDLLLLSSVPSILELVGDSEIPFAPDK
jgi:hypothetical protein